MVTQLGAKGPLDKRFFERHRGILNGFGIHRAADELVDQLFWNGWKVTRGLTGRFLFGRHTCTSSTCYARTQNFCPPLCAYCFTDSQARSLNGQRQFKDSGAPKALKPAFEAKHFKRLPPLPAPTTKPIS
nr:hypothetical protein [Pseudomonas gingeri]